MGRFIAWLAGHLIGLPALLGRMVGFALKHWRPIVMAVLALSLWIQHGTLVRVTAGRDAARAAQVNPATGKLWRVEAQRDAEALGRCHGNVDRLNGALDRQNAAVTAAKARGDRMAAAAAAAAREAQGARAVAESRARAVMDATVSDATCAARDADLLKLAGESVR